VLSHNEDKAMEKKTEKHKSTCLLFSCSSDEFCLLVVLDALFILI